MLYAGNFLIVLGIMMLSLCKTYWQVFLAQGLCMGFGAGLLYIPSLALVGIWFERKRAMALGIVMSGIAVGKSTSEIGYSTPVSNNANRWSNLHHNVRPAHPQNWLPLDHPRNRLRLPQLRSPLLPRTPLWKLRPRAPTQTTRSLR